MFCGGREDDEGRKEEEKVYFIIASPPSRPPLFKFPSLSLLPASESFPSERDTTPPLHILSFSLSKQIRISIKSRANTYHLNAEKAEILMGQPSFN